MHTPPTHDEMGRPVEIVYSVRLKCPAEGMPDQVHVLRADGRHYLWHPAFSYTGLNSPSGNFADARYLVREIAAQLDRAEKHRRQTAAFVEEWSALCDLTQSETIARGRKHHVYGKLWRALRNPVIIQGNKRHHDFLFEEAEGGCLGITNQEVLAWFEEREYAPKIMSLPLTKVRMEGNKFVAFSQTIFDFETFEQAFEFKMSWF
jgi:hypothetical protein